MPTNLALDNKLIEEAVKIGKHKTKKDAVTAELIEYVRFRKQQKVKALFGLIEYDAAYDYKKQRAVK
ncbi:MAG: type II toxin-antitoxin system VapB family antitoxin [Ignavibacteriales bacterium]|nr:type II toxin-antitoxin system VapB family antitoxin [Ignavibacteriales bacterium]